MLIARQHKHAITTLRSRGLLDRTDGFHHVLLHATHPQYNLCLCALPGVFRVLHHTTRRPLSGECCLGPNDLQIVLEVCRSLATN